MQGTAYCFFADDEDLSYALQQLMSLHSTCRSAEARSNDPCTRIINTEAFSSHYENDARKISHANFQCFCKDQKCTGKLWADVQEFINNYKQACSEYNFSLEQKMLSTATTFWTEKKNFTTVNPCIPTNCHSTVVHKLLSESTTLPTVNFGPEKCYKE